MSPAIIVLLLVGFSLCVTVGLLTVLQSLVSGDSVDETAQGPVFQDHRAFQDQRTE